jgi:predicted metal-dependent hydrolase
MTRRREPADVPEPTHAALVRGIALFDARRFFEAHECFEHIWKAKDVSARDRDFWKGVTQVAVGCCHAQRGNARGAHSLIDRAIRALGLFPSPHCGVDTAALIACARRVADQVTRRGASLDLDFPLFPPL